MEDYSVPPFDKKKYPYCWDGYQYALKIVSGEIPACIYVIGACKKSLREFNDKFHPKFLFVPEKAEKYLRQVQKFHHVNGHWATSNIVYDPWQNWVWMNITGFISRTTGFIRFRLAHVDIARGNGKSAMASQAALSFMCLDNPNGNQVATVATKKDQARIVLDAARSMAGKNEAFCKKVGVVVQAHSILHPKSNSLIRALAADAKSMDGLNDVLAVLDELHAMARKVFDVITSGMSKRRDSLTLCITTAGDNIESVGYSQNAYAKKVCLGEVVDDSMFAVVYTLDEDDKWDDEKNWIKANPASWTDYEDLRAKAARAKDKPADLPNFMIKHLNIWISETKAYFDKKKWDACADPNLKIEDFKGHKMKSAIDLASYLDLTSIAKVFRKDGIYYFFWENYLPEETIKNLDNDIYHEAVKLGDLIATPGEVINYEKIGDRVLEIQKGDSKISECAYDPWRAAELAQRLSGKVEMIEFAMRIGNFSEPMKKFDALMREKKIRHTGSPLIRWCLGNVVAITDANDNCRPNKSHEKLKIDPIVAGLMAFALWLQTEEKVSIYETKGISKL